MILWCKLVTVTKTNNIQNKSNNQTNSLVKTKMRTFSFPVAYTVDDSNILFFYEIQNLKFVIV